MGNVSPKHRRATAKTGATVVDIDVHIHEDPLQLAEYAEMPWKRSLRALGGYPEHDLDLPGLSPSTIEDGLVSVPEDSRPLPRAQTPVELRRVLDRRGVDGAILFPDHLLKMAMLDDVDYSVSLVRAYNMWLTKDWLGKAVGLYGALCVAPQDPKGSAVEVERYAKDPRIACIFLPTAGLQRLYGHRRYDPIYAAAEKTGRPVVLHSLHVLSPSFPFQLEQFPNKFGRFAMSDSLAMAANLVHMMSAGVFERFPKLRVCFADGGISWLPWLMSRLDKEYLDRREEVSTFLKKRPSRYMRDFGYSTQPVEEPGDEDDYGRLLQLAGEPRSVMYGSDWPHRGFDEPEKITGLRLSEDTKRGILGENAVKFFSLNLRGSA